MKNYSTFFYISEASKEHLISINTERARKMLTHFYHLTSQDNVIGHTTFPICNSDNYEEFN